MEFKKVLNPVPYNFADHAEGSGDTTYFYPVNLTSINQPVGIEENCLNTQYISLHGMRFNNFSMTFPTNYSSVPFLLQSPTKNSRQCGVKCEYGNPTCKHLLPDDCGKSFPPSERCNCQHLIQQPWLPGSWFETVLINERDERDGTQDLAHPIHQHGG